MLKQYSTGNVLKINAKPMEHPGPCSMLGAGHYPRTGVRRGRGAISDFRGLAGMLYEQMIR